MKGRKENKVISRILVPTDFSASAAEALEYAMTLAKSLKAELILAHVVEPFPYNLVEGMTFVDYGKYLTPPTRHLLDHLSKGPIKEKIPVKSCLVEGVPFLEIIRIAEREGADLIVMGTHGRTGIDRLLTGSVAEKVVRLSSCPVLTVRSAPAGPKRGTAKRPSSAGVRHRSIEGTS